MFSVGQDWNHRQSLLKQAIKEQKIDKIKDLLYELHSIVHSSRVYKSQKSSFLDEICEDLNEKAFRIMPTSNDVTIAWNIWHITRIEDITSNILIANTNSILTDTWLERMKISIRDTGNAMSDEEILSFSNEIFLEELLAYRDSVGIRTKQIIENLTLEDLKRKFMKSQLNNILTEGGVLEHPESIWLLDFWGKKNVGGILLMPVTRHQVVHLNDCNKLKKKCGNLKT